MKVRLIYQALYLINLTMNSLFIDSTKTTPRIDFRQTGIFILEGKTCPVNVNTFYNPIFRWIDGIIIENVVFDIKLEYINSASVKKIFELLKHIDTNNNIKKISINWHYEEGDDDILETGQILAESLTRPEFRYCEFSEAE